MTRQLAGPSLPEIELELGLSHTQSGLFVLLMGIGFSLSQLGAAFLAATSLFIFSGIWIVRR